MVAAAASVALAAAVAFAVGVESVVMRENKPLGSNEPLCQRLIVHFRLEVMARQEQKDLGVASGVVLSHL